MNPFKFSDDDSSPFENQPRVQWLPRRQRSWKWPADYRSFMGFVFAVTIPTSLWSIARAILHPRSRTLLQKVLVGPMFHSAMAALSGIALWAIWKDKSWARSWAVAASAIHIFVFLRQFVIPVRPAPTWDHHYLTSLVVGVIGVVAFSRRDREVDAGHSASVNTVGGQIHGRSNSQNAS
jgi:hypothetical protein